jgi:hypothetical protein
MKCLVRLFVVYADVSIVMLTTTLRPAVQVTIANQMLRILNPKQNRIHYGVGAN